MNKLQINGLKNVQGMKFHDIEGGFGENKKSMLAKDISVIHGRDIKDINRNINNNIERFKNGVDILDLKTGEYKPLVLEMGFTNAQYGNANNIYLLSERGYSKLLKILEDDVAWEQYEKLVDGYFNMREKIKKPKLSKEVQAIFLLDERTIEIENKVNSLEANMPLFNVECKELQASVRRIGINTLGGKDKPAYKDNSIRGKVYSDIQYQLKREFGVTRYEGIKRCQLNQARGIVENYKAPIVLTEEINRTNSQIDFREVM